MSRAIWLMRATGLAVVLLAVTNLAQAADACVAPGKCQFRVGVTFTPAPTPQNPAAVLVVVVETCTNNCTPTCVIGTAPGGKTYCYCPADPDNNGDGLPDSVLCNVGYERVGNGILSQCMTAIGCTAPAECKLVVKTLQAPAGSTAYDIQCCCE